LDELGIAFEAVLGAERIILSFEPDRISSGSARAVVQEVDAGNLADSFVRDDGALLAPPRRTTSTLPATLSIAAPEGDELLTLMQRALQLDLQRSGITVELITAPVSRLYGSWSAAAPADVALIRSLVGPASGRFQWPLVSVETVMAWRDEVHGIAVNPALEGPLWNARDWWIGPSI
jgi:hypothetical protein